MRSSPISSPIWVTFIATAMNAKMHVVIAYSLRVARPSGVSRLFNQNVILFVSNIVVGELPQALLRAASTREAAV